LKVFFDNNLSPHLAHALNVLLDPEGDQVIHLTDRYAGRGENATDCLKEERRTAAGD
jgi:hypothetical protein